MIELNLPELVQAVGVAATGILGTWTARNSRKIKELSERVAAVEKERDDLKEKLRSAVHYIRAWLGWHLHHAPDIPGPELPDDLRDEV